MHISFLTSEYPHTKANKSAGIGSSIKNLVTELKKKGFSVTLFIYGQKEDDAFVENGINYHLIKHIKYRIFGWYLYRKHLQNYINKVAQTESIDLLETPEWTGVSAFIKLKIPLIIRLHGSDAYFCHLEGRKQKKKNFFFENKALNGADAIVSVSKFTAQVTKRIFKLNKEISIIHNGINTEKFSPIIRSNNSNSILYFGTIIRKKGVFELAQAFNYLNGINPKANLILLGKDVIDIFEKKSTLEIFYSSLTEEAKEKVTHIEEVHYSEVAEIIAKSSLVTLPSLAEAFPMTWLEAMAMGKAMVTSNIGWADEMMVDGETGFMINPKDSKDYAIKMNILLEDTILSTKCGKNARKRILEEFDSTIIVNKNIDFYKNLIKN